MIFFILISYSEIKINEINEINKIKMKLMKKDKTRLNNNSIII